MSASLQTGSLQTAIALVKAGRIDTLRAVVDTSAAAPASVAEGGKDPSTSVAARVLSGAGQRWRMELLDAGALSGRTVSIELERPPAKPLMAGDTVALRVALPQERPAAGRSSAATGLTGTASAAASSPQDGEAEPAASAGQGTRLSPAARLGQALLQGLSGAAGGHPSGVGTASPAQTSAIALGLSASQLTGAPAAAPHTPSAVSPGASAALSTATTPSTAQSAAHSLQAGQLAQAVGESGVFYESHLGQWVRGERGIESLRTEPQNRTAPGAEGALQAASVADAAGVTAAQTGGADTLLAQGVPARLLPLLREQLAALEHGECRFRLPAWPGQDADLTVGEEPAGATAAGLQATWSARLALDLPSLGHVEAGIRICGQAVQLSLKADDAARQSLREHAPHLLEQLDAAGLRVAHWTVHSGETGS